MIKKIILISCAAFILENCSSIERATSEAFGDMNVKGRIEHLWFTTKKDFYKDLTITVVERRVLLTGVVATPQDHVEAVRLAWQAEGVKEVVDKIKIGEAGWGSYTSDSWITLQVKNALLFEKGVNSTRYTTLTVDGVVYLLGVADDQTELDKVLTLSRTIKGVKQVVSYIRLRANPEE